MVSDEAIEQALAIAYGMRLCSWRGFALNRQTRNLIPGQQAVRNAVFFSKTIKNAVNYARAI